MDTVLSERRGAVVIITLNRPQKANSVDAAMSYEVDRLLGEAEADDTIGAIILTAAGDRVFCSGMDLKEAASSAVGRGLVPGRGFCGVTERNFSKPIICAVNGMAVAGGMEIALACDMIVAADHTVFGVPEVKRGLFPWAGGVQRMARHLPRQIALEIILTGANFSAQRIHELGVVNRVVPKAQLIDEALKLANEMLANSWPAIRYARKLFDAAQDMPLSGSLALGHQMGREMLSLEDSKEGVAAYAEKRDAKFTHTESKS